MLYHVRMDVRPPHGLDPAEFDRLKAAKGRAQDLQRAGTWVHLWRVPMTSGMADKSDSEMDWHAARG